MITRTARENNDKGQSPRSAWLAQPAAWWSGVSPQTLLCGLAAVLAWPLGMWGIDSLWNIAGFTVPHVGVERPHASDVFYGAWTISESFVLTLLNGSASEVLHSVCRIAWGTLVCAVFGAAICRCVAMRHATGRTPATAEVFTFTLPRWLQLWLAPLIPLVVCAVLWSLRFAAQSVGWIPLGGEYLYAALWLFFTGLMWTLVLLTAAAWPLMFAAQCVERSDCFDGLSRAFNLTLSAPVRYLLTLVGFVTVGFGIGYLCQMTIRAGLGSAAGEPLISGLLVIPGAVAMAAFFSWATFTFLELRACVDATETDEVYSAGSEVVRVPLVGRAAHPVAGQ